MHIKYVSCFLFLLFTLWVFCYFLRLGF
ncbi:BnaCnng69990D [Brassica napus]|uniref:BnaCnng69990D protein n=1 Tax=Brassica napus TaxID=3708 RepID=A0A078JTF0_BRANA|nr:BnaCnng69990D [Brassica napus]